MPIRYSCDACDAEMTMHEFNHSQTFSMALSYMFVKPPARYLCTTCAVKVRDVIQELLLDIELGAK